MCHIAPQKGAKRVMEYLFIVGLPRTGTKLMRDVLSSSRGVACHISPETWFFGDRYRGGLRDKLGAFDLKSRSGVEKLADYIQSGKHKGSYSRWMGAQGGEGEESKVRRTLFVESALQSDRTDRGIYEAMMLAFARSYSSWEAHTCQAIGDKTPGHLYYVPTIVEWFPSAKIIHTFRDPRAVLASQLLRIAERRPGAPQRKHGMSGPVANKLLFTKFSVLLYVTLTWRKAAYLHARYQHAYPGNYLLCRYEDLVLAPERQVKVLSSFLGMPIDMAMLRPRLRGSSFIRDSDKKGFDSEATERWKIYLPHWMRVWALATLGPAMRRHGYRMNS